MSEESRLTGESGVYEPCLYCGRDAIFPEITRLTLHVHDRCVDCGAFSSRS